MEYPIKRFTGGMTDEPLAADANQYQRMDNLVMNDQGDPYTRPGSVLFDSSNAQLPTGDQRVGALINFDQDTALIGQSAKRAFSYSSGWNEILGPSGNPVFTAGDANARVSTAIWKGHVFLTNDAGTSPMKIFRTGATTFKALNASLPRFPDNLDPTAEAALLSSAITLANAIKAKMSAHFNDNLNHQNKDLHAFAANATDLASLHTLTLDLMAAHYNHITDARTSYTDPPTNSFHAWSNANINHSFGHFYLPVTNPPVSLRDIVQVLNNLKRLFNYHIDSFFTALVTATNSTLDNPVHPGPTVGLITAADAAVDPLPVITPKIYLGTEIARADSGRAVLYQWADAIRQAAKAHYVDSGKHTSPSGNWVSNVTINDDHTLVLGLYKIIIGYLSHRLENGSVHANSPDPVGSLPSAAVTDLIGIFSGGTNFFNFSEPRTPLDPSTASGCNLILSVINDLATHFNVHIQSGGASGRHVAASTDTLIGTYTASYPLSATPQPTNFVQYLYAFVYRNTYTTYGGLEFEDLSAPYIVMSPPVADAYSAYVSTNNLLRIGYMTKVDHPKVAITGITALPATENYPTDTGTIQIYRSVANDTTLHLIAEIANGITSYMDEARDSEITDFEQLYTTGGVVDNDPAPKAKFIKLAGSKLYYGNVVDENGNAYPNRILESLSNNLGAVPGASYIDLPQPVAGLGTTKSMLVAFTKNQTYRIEGGYDETGRGQLNEVIISDQVGLVAGYSPVEIDGGIVFFGNDGVYFTDAYQVKKISRDWLKTYLSLVSDDKVGAIMGVLDKQANRVHWGITYASGATDNDQMLTLSLKQGLSENACFQTASNVGFGATALTFFKKQIIRGDSHGYVYKHDEAYKSDPRVDTGASASTWAKQAIRYDLRTAAFDFGDIKSRKWIPSLVAKFKNLGNLSCQITSINDDGKGISLLTPIRWRGKPSFGDVAKVAFAGGPGWINRNLIEAFRHFPSGSLRCSNKQLQLTLAKVALAHSDDLGQATLNPIAKTLTLLSGSWPSDLEDQVVALDADGYVTEYTVVSATGGVLTFSDDCFVPGGVVKWVVRGYPKDERMQFVSLSLNVSGGSDSVSSATASEMGENA